MLRKQYYCYNYHFSLNSESTRQANGICVLPVIWIRATGPTPPSVCARTSTTQFPPAGRGRSMDRLLVVNRIEDWPSLYSTYSTYTQTHIHCQYKENKVPNNQCLTSERKVIIPYIKTNNTVMLRVGATHNIIVRN